MISSHPTDPKEYQEWIKKLERDWQAGLIPNPQAVAIIISSDQNEVLLQLRDNNPEISFANFWTLPGGVVETNETPERVARRELAEETGLHLQLSRWKVYNRTSENHKIVIEQYVYTGTTRQPASEMILGEGQAIQFFRPNELQALPIAYGFDKLLVEFFDVYRLGKTNRSIET